jgi:hypothetical protein
MDESTYAYSSLEQIPKLSIAKYDSRLRKIKILAAYPVDQTAQKIVRFSNANALKLRNLSNDNCKYLNTNNLTRLYNCIEQILKRLQVHEFEIKFINLNRCYSKKTSNDIYEILSHLLWCHVLLDIGLLKANNEIELKEEIKFILENDIDLFD